MVLKAIVGDKKIDELVIRTVANDPFKSQNYSNQIQITENWPSHVDLRELSDGLFTGIFNINDYNYDEKAKNWELQHSRELTIELSSGKIFKLFFDQGMGFWTPWYKKGLNDRWIETSQNNQSIIEGLICKISGIVINSPKDWDSFIAIKEI